MANHAENPFYTHYEANAHTYESINNFKKDIVHQLLKLCPRFDVHAIILDNACGPGIVSGEIQKMFTSSNMPQIHAVDFSPKMIDVLNQKAKVEKWTRVEAAVMDAENLTFEDDKFTHSITNFGIFLLPDPVKAAAEVYRTLQPGGVAIVTAWYRLEWLDVLQKLQHNIKPEAILFDGPSPGWMGTEKLKDVILGGGFQPERLKMMSLRTTLSGEQRDIYLGAMKTSLDT